MLSLSGRGRLLEVRLDHDDDDELQGVGMVVQADDVHLPMSRGVRVYLHWMCGEAAARGWVELHRKAPGSVCYFSGVGPLVENATLIGDDVPFFEMMANFVAPDILSARPGS